MHITYVYMSLLFRGMLIGRGKGRLGKSSRPLQATSRTCFQVARLRRRVPKFVRFWVAKVSYIACASALNSSSLSYKYLLN